MKKTMLVLLMTLTASSAFSKQLTVVCDRQDPNIANVTRAAFAAILEIANVNSAPTLQELYVSGAAATRAQVSQHGITKSTVDLSIQFDPRLYSTARISLQDCQDSFAATGTAEVDKHVGGFAGTSRQNLTCTCELK